MQRKARRFCHKLVGQQSPHEAQVAEREREPEARAHAEQRAQAASLVLDVRCVVITFEAQ